MPTWISALAALAPLLERYGLPAIQQIIATLSAPTAPTQADWDKLAALTSTTPRQQMLAVLAAHGIDPTSPAGVAFLALTP